MANHGDITDVTFNHPDIGSGRFLPKAAEGNTMDPGGIRTADDAAAVTSNGTMLWKKNRVRGFFEVVIEDDQEEALDALKVAELAAHPKEAVWTFTMINNTVWQGTGKPVGDIQPNVDDGTFTLKVAAPAFVKISG